MEVLNEALLGAAIKGNVAKVEKLLEEGADATCLVEDSASLIHSATKRNNEEMVSLILKYVFLEDNERLTNFIVDIVECNKNLKLLQAISKELIGSCVHSLDLEILGLLLKQGLPIDGDINEHGWTLLHHSISNEKNDLVSIIVVIIIITCTD